MTVKRSVLAIVAVLAAVHLAGVRPAGGAGDDQSQAEMRKLAARAYVTVLPVPNAPRPQRVRPSPSAAP